ncbi:hypothetical protein RHSIM_Rhsim02G0018000 [Rhododendron simsii]|uniref:Uncharacterized protein n=1 Tax=Rhododendron simsii TaxID=118357 RepID=A0A834LWM2_RHOSS|nr:hypothetical protein RHSIM_Rhsim02G0018000 [Rhododendron simsii]
MTNELPKSSLQYCPRSGVLAIAADIDLFACQSAQKREWNMEDSCANLNPIVFLVGLKISSFAGLSIISSASSYVVFPIVKIVQFVCSIMLCLLDSHISEMRKRNRSRAISDGRMRKLLDENKAEDQWVTERMEKFQPFYVTCMYSGASVGCALTEVMNPTTPAMREKITKNPVARLPNGKYIGKIRAGIDNTDAASNIQLSVMK